MELNLNGKKVHYIDEGQGRCALLLHGWGAEIGIYRLITEKLSRNFRVFAPDMPGVGGSDEPEAPMDLDSYVRFVYDFCRAVDCVPELVVGHSNGGRVLLRILGDDNTFQVRKAVIIDSSGVVHEKTLGQRVRTRAFKIIRTVLSTKPMTRLFPNALDRARSHFGSSDYKNASEVMRRTLVNLVNTDIRQWLPKIKAETLLIWGENDSDTPLADGKLMESLIPGAGLVTLKGAGHYSFLDRWSQFSAVLDSFLQMDD